MNIYTHCVGCTSCKEKNECKCKDCSKVKWCVRKRCFRFFRPHTPIIFQNTATVTAGICNIEIKTNSNTVVSNKVNSSNDTVVLEETISLDNIKDNIIDEKQNKADIDNAILELKPNKKTRKK